MTVWTPDNVADIRKFAGISIDEPEELHQTGVVQVIYGAPGSGKTTLAAQLIDSPFVKRGALWLNADAGHDAIQHLIDQKKVQNVTITDYAQVEKITAEYSREQPWDLIVCDNVTEFQALIHTGIRGTNAIEIQDYGISTAKIMSLARQWRKLANKHGLTVLLLCWEFASTDKEDRKDGEYTVTRRSIDLTDKLGQRFPGVVGTVMHITKENDKDLTRKLWMDGPSTRTQAKLRRDDVSSAAWSIPNEIFYRRGETPLVDIMATLREGVMFPKDKYKRNAQGKTDAT